ncbi:MAG: EF-hand domain-containing protein [Caulobacter sp.]
MNKTVRNIIVAGVALACLGGGGVWALTSMDKGVSLKPSAQNTRRDLTHMNDVQLLEFAKTSFLMTDRNKDGVIELDEAPKARVTNKKNGEVVNTETSPELWITRFDEDKDNKVSWDEYYAKVKFLAKKGKQKKDGEEDCVDCKPIV